MSFFSIFRSSFRFTFPKKMLNSLQFIFFFNFVPFFCLQHLLINTLANPSADHRLRELRVIDRTNVFDQRFLQRALRGQIPGIDVRFILDLAYWFHSKSIPCCERLLGQTGYRHLYNCTSLPDPTDHSSTVFMYRMIFECIGEQRDVSDCCHARGIRKNCLHLCDASHPPMSPDEYENEGTSQTAMAVCATEMGIPKERLLWTIFECLNPQFSKVMRMTQMMKAEEERQRILEKISVGRKA